MIGQLVTVLLLILIALSSVRGDHLPRTLQARGKPETRLAGINLRRAKLTDIIKRYGQPSNVKAWEQDNPRIANSYDYYWINRNWKLHVLIQRFSDENLGEYVSLIEVEAVDTVPAIARTGSGLKLGDRMSDLKRFYGPRFQERKLPAPRIHDVTIQWRRQEYSLVATLDQRGRISKLSLSAPE